MLEVKKPAKRPSSKGAPPSAPAAAVSAKQHGATDKPSSHDKVPMNFKTDADFQREYKMFAAMHGMSMVDVLKESFDLLKKTKDVE